MSSRGDRPTEPIRAAATNAGARRAGHLLGTPAPLPVSLKVFFTAFMLFWVPTVLWAYGPMNFLWLCNLANFMLLVGIWARSRLLISTAFVNVIVIDLAWNLDLLVRLVAAFHPFGATAYMWNAELPLIARLSSLYHVFLPPLLIVALRRVGYEGRALVVQSALALVFLPASYLLSTRAWNINWVFGPGAEQHFMPDLAWLALTLVGYPLLLYLPAHLVGRKLFPKRGAR